MADDDLDQESQRQLSPVGLYSHAADVAQRFPQMKGTPQQFKAMLTKQGVKPDEFKNSNYDQTFAGRPMVTRDELARHFNASVPPVQETTLSSSHAADYAGRRDRPVGAPQPTEYHSYQLPGGTNYRETLLHLPLDMSHSGRIKVANQKVDAIQNAFNELHKQPDSAALAMHRADLARQEREAYAELKAAHDAPSKDYRSSHWKDTPNVLAHLRMSDRKGPKGEKILHLEELQSDWAQEGRKKGFRQPVSEDEIREGARILGDMGPNTTPEEQERYRDIARRAHGVPAAPYVDSTQKWVDLGLKRALHEAAKGGYHKLVITPGEEQAKRYDLSKHIKHIRFARSSALADVGDLSATGHNQEQVINQHVAVKDLPDIIGKEVAERLLKTRGQQSEIEGSHVNVLRNQDLKVGGEGMKAFYDKMLPQALEKLAKKHDPDAKVGPSHIVTNKSGWHIIPASNSINGKWIVKTSDYTSTGKHFNDEAAAQKYLDEKAEKTPVHSLDITPKMRASILKGQPAYAQGGAVDKHQPPHIVGHALHLVQNYA